MGGCHGPITITRSSTSAGRQHGGSAAPHSRRREAAASPEVARPHLTFAFLDLCGFTAFTEASGDLAAVRVLSMLRSHVREAEADHASLRVVKWLGDGVMLCGPGCAEAIACTSAILGRWRQEGELALRGGMAHGPAIPFEGSDYVGSVLNIASRLCAIASPGQLLVAGDDEASLPAGVFASRVHRLDVAGLSRPVKAMVVTR